MININDGDVIGSDGGSKLVNTEPGSGTISIFKSIPGGGHSDEAFIVIDSSTSQVDRAFYLPTPNGMSWKFSLTADALAEYTKHQTSNL